MAHASITHVLIATTVAMTTAGALATAQNTPSLADILEGAGTYLASYQDRATMVVLEEDYRQSRDYGRSAGANMVNQSLETRRLRSDVVMLVEPGPRWVSFRDVFEVDGRPVRDRDERLARLFLEPDSQTRADRVERIFAEGARFNLLPEFPRTINVPFTALVFLIRSSQARSTFRLDGTETVGGLRTVVLRFTEQALPRLSMGVITNQASYGNLRQFQVDTASKVSTPAK